MIPKYEAIAADIRRSIEDGALKPGDKLPTVVEFCELYSVSKITVKRAIEQIARGRPLLPAGADRDLRQGHGGASRPGVFKARTTVPKGFSYEHRGEE